MFGSYRKRNSRRKRSEKKKRRKLDLEECQKNSKSRLGTRCNFHYPLHHFVNPTSHVEYIPAKNKKENRINFCLNYPYFTTSQEQKRELLKFLKEELKMLTRHQSVGKKIKRSMTNATGQNSPTEILLNNATGNDEEHTSKEISNLNPSNDKTKIKDRKNNYYRSSLPPAFDSHPRNSLFNDVPSPVMIPKVEFKYPYDLKLFERSSFRGRNLRSGEGSVSGNRNNKFEESDAEKTPHNVQKLKHVLEEVENMLRDEVTETSESKENIASDANATRGNPSDESIKDKIDKVAIPLLMEISDQLSQQSGEASSKTKSEKLDNAVDRKSSTVKYGKKFYSTFFLNCLFTGEQNFSNLILLWSRVTLLNF